jgi:hypothetical protein
VSHRPLPERERPLPYRYRVGYATSIILISLPLAISGHGTVVSLVATGLFIVTASSHALTLLGKRVKTTSHAPVDSTPSD